MEQNKERDAFEAWMRGCEGYPYAGQFANLMWKAWQARAAHSQTDAWQPADVPMPAGLLSNMDAWAWAEHFAQVFPGQAHMSDLMHTWFANAIMCGFDEANRRATPSPRQMVADSAGEAIDIEQIKQDYYKQGFTDAQAMLAAPAPTASPAVLTDEQIADMASAYGVYYDADPAIIGRFARALLAAQPPAAAEAEQDAPDMFWNHDDPERCQDSVHNVVVEAYENGCNVGDIVEVQQAIRLHNIKVRIIADPEDSEEISFELVEDAAMSAGTAPKGEKA